MENKKPVVMVRVREVDLHRMAFLIDSLSVFVTHPLLDALRMRLREIREAARTGYDPSEY
jgi:hypothetical protein